MKHLLLFFLLAFIISSYSTVNGQNKNDAELFHATSSHTSFPDTARVKWICKQQGITFKELAERMNVSRGQLQECCQKMEIQHFLRW